MVWARSPGHYEVWYTTLSHRASSTGFWIRYTLEAPTHGEAYAQLWFARFDAHDPAATFGINRRFPISQLRSETSPFLLAIGDAYLRHDPMQGSLAGSGHEVRWDLRWRPATRTVRFLPDLAYHSNLATTKVHSPNQDIRLSGEIVVDGQRYAMDGDAAGQTHVWGRKHAYSWGWAHCNSFDPPGASLEVLSVRLQRASVILPTLTMFTLFLDGEQFAFRQPWAMPFARSHYATGTYIFSGAHATARIEGSFSCRPEDMILAEYVDPDGDPAFCHNSCCAAAEVKVWRRSPFVGRWREHRRLATATGGHFEWGGRAGDVLRVKKSHEAV